MRYVVFLNTGFNVFIPLTRNFFPLDPAKTPFRKKLMPSIPERTAEAVNPTDSNFEFAALAESHNYRRIMIDEFRNFLKGHVVEIGCGVGQMTAELQRLEQIVKLTCVEPGAEFAAEHRKRIQGVTLVEGIASDLPPGIAPDAMVSVNVLEHIEQDQAELCLYRELLSGRSGHLCLLVPARPELYAPIDADFGHFRRYQKPELRGKLEQAGFTVRHLFYFNWVGYFGWLVNFRLLKSRAFDIQQVRFHDRVVAPAVHWMETRISRPPFGQSLIAIAQA